MDVLWRVHGPRARNLSEAKGHFFDWMGATTPRNPPEVGRSFHYAIVRDEAGAAPAQGSRIARAGPYTVVECQPLIVYSTWECADTFRDRGDRPGTEAVEWATIRIPTAGPQTSTGYGLEPPRHWRGPVVACRGDISVAGPRPMRIVVSLRGPILGDRGIEAFHVNGVPVMATRLRAHSTFVARNLDAVFDVGDHLRAGTNTVALRLVGRPPRFDLDVYEIRPVD